MKLVQLIERNTFIKHLACFGGLGSKSGPLLIYQPNAITEKQIMSFGIIKKAKLVY